MFKNVKHLLSEMLSIVMSKKGGIDQSASYDAKRKFGSQFSQVQLSTFLFTKNINVHSEKGKNKK